MSKKSLRLYIIGGLCMGFGLFARHIPDFSIDLTDFIKGLGVAFLLASVFFMKTPQENTQA